MPAIEVGKRITIVRTSDPYSKLQPGAEGTIISIDDLGTVHVNWDDGSTLGLIPGEDIFLTLAEEGDHGV